MSVPRQRSHIMPSSYTLPSFPCFVPPSSCRQQQSVCVAAVRGLTECLPLCKAFVRYAFCALNGLFYNTFSLLGRRRPASYRALASWRDLPASSQIGHTLETVFFHGRSSTLFGRRLKHALRLGNLLVIRTHRRRTICSGLQRRGC